MKRETELSVWLALHGLDETTRQYKGPCQIAEDARALVSIARRYDKISEAVCNIADYVPKYAPLEERATAIVESYAGVSIEWNRDPRGSSMRLVSADEWKRYV